MTKTGVAARTATIVVSAGAALLLLLAYWPTLRWLVNSWLSSDYYSHGFLMPVVAAVFVWTKRDRFKNREPYPWAWAVLAAPVLLYALGLALGLRVLGALSLITLLATFALATLGPRAGRALMAPLAFLLFAVPFPFITDLAFSLQQISVHWSSTVLAITGLPVATSGSEILLNNDITFSVGIVCSGINTLVALLALAAVYVYLLTGGPLRRAGLLVLAFPVAIAGNVLRIVSIIVVAYYAGVGTATGWYHDLSSPLFFFLEFLILIGVAYLLRCRINYRLFWGPR